MDIIKRKSVLKFGIGIGLVCLLTVGVFPVIMANESEYSYHPGATFVLFSAPIGAFTPTTEYNVQIKELVVKGAVPYLKAKSEFSNLSHLLLNYYINESIPVLSSNCTNNICTTSGNCSVFSSSECGNIRNSIDCVIANLNESSSKYNDLINCASQADRREEVVKYLKHGEWPDVLTNIYSYYTLLDKISIATLEKKLRLEGKTEEVYKTLKCEVDLLLVEVEALRESFKCDPEQPAIYLLGRKDRCIDRILLKVERINSIFDRGHMFGQYAAQLFRHIRDNLSNLNGQTFPSHQKDCLAKEKRGEK